ncbi:hypothetical protein BvCmsOUNP037_01453 [Escherichia coli]|nr:hypothetical protein BvCmsOUNP037_01453 [Escherichia coli]
MVFEVTSLVFDIVLLLLQVGCCNHVKMRRSIFHVQKLFDKFLASQILKTLN